MNAFAPTLLSVRSALAPTLLSVRSALALNPLSVRGAFALTPLSVRGAFALTPLSVRRYLIPASCDNNVQPGEGRRLTACGMVEDCAYACCWCVNPPTCLPDALPSYCRFSACALTLLSVRSTCCTLAQMSRHTYANEDCSPLTDPGKPTNPQALNPKP
jgi:hypothetical protein